MNNKELEQAKENDLMLNDLTKLSKKDKQTLTKMLNDIVKMVFSGDRCSWYIDANNDYRLKTSNLTYDILTIYIGMENNKFYTKYQNMVRLVNIIYGDDEPFTDCGVNLYQLGNEIREILKQIK